MYEIHNHDELRAWLAQGAAREPAAVQGLDLSALRPAQLEGPFEGSLFLGCDLDSAHTAAHLVSAGAVVLPAMPRFHFRIHRPGLYTPEELFAGFEPDDERGYHKTLDHRIYRQYLDDGGPTPDSIRTSLARRLHDHSITNALHELIRGRRVVAIMGGHSLPRAHPIYASVARISRTLTRLGYLMVSGGGPGAMEATHLGAHLAARPDDDLDDALRILSVRPAGAVGGEHEDWDWLHRAWRVREAFPIPAGQEARCLSIGIPTWLYGHEPPAPFAARVAKYFANSVREDGLLAIAMDGVIFAPGSAGTTQEIFQDACQNHYGTFGHYSPMILLGRRFWTEERPVWPLLERVSRDRVYGELLFLTDDEEAVVRKIRTYDPDVYKSG